jgi:hypothetical protein
MARAKKTAICSAGFRHRLLEQQKIRVKKGSEMKLTIDQIAKRIVGSLLLAIAFLTAASALANAQGNANTPFTGVWETVAGIATKYTVRLTQVGNKVTGTYTPGNGKIFGGVVVGKRLTFKWTQDEDQSGTGEFTLNPDRKGFTGSSTTINPSPATQTWKTYIPDPPWSFAGTWAIWRLNSEFSTNITLSISQKGDKVTGTYPAENGKIEGTVSGRNLRFKWESDEGSGSGLFNISTSEKSFGGWFNDGDDPDVEGTRWTSSRISTGKAAPSTNGEAPVKKDPEPSFDGVWNVVEGGSSSILVIKQLVASASGAYATNRGTYELKNTYVNGNILRFTVARPNSAVPVSIAELILDPDGKSFKGTVNGNPVTGTFVRPN